MTTPVELRADEFFASRSGVSVYVKVLGHRFRVQFATPDAHGVVSDGALPGADQALELARTALHKHQAALVRLFEKVARSQT